MLSENTCRYVSTYVCLSAASTQCIYPQTTVTVTETVTVTVTVTIMLTVTIKVTVTVIVTDMVMVTVTVGYSQRHRLSACLSVVCNFPTKLQGILRGVLVSLQGSMEMSVCPSDRLSVCLRVYICNLRTNGSYKVVGGLWLHTS